MGSRTAPLLAARRAALVGESPDRHRFQVMGVGGRTDEEAEQSRLKDYCAGQIIRAFSRIGLPISLTNIHCSTMMCSCTLLSGKVEKRLVCNYFADVEVGGVTWYRWWLIRRMWRRLRSGRNGHA